MADIFTLANLLTVQGTLAAPYTQDLTEVLDVSGYESVDFQVAAYAVDDPTGFTVSLLTSMQNKSDDASWVVVGTSTLFTSAPAFAQIAVPVSPNTTPLLRYVRYRVNFGSGATSATFSVTGLARKGVRPTAPSTLSWPLAGTTHDFTADANWTASGMTDDGSTTNNTDMLGDGTTEPRFYVVRKTSLTALARNADGLRLTAPGSNTETAANLYTWPKSENGGALHLALPEGDTRVDVTVAFNGEAIGRNTGTNWYDMSLAVMLWGTNNTALPGPMARVALYSYGATDSGKVQEKSFAWADNVSSSNFDVSTGGEGTSGGVTVRDVRFIIRGHVVQVLTGPHGGALTSRLYRSDPRWNPSRGGRRLAIGLGQYVGTPWTGLWAELRSLQVTPF